MRSLRNSTRLDARVFVSVGSTRSSRAFAKRRMAQGPWNYRTPIGAVFPPVVRSDLEPWRGYVLSVPRLSKGHGIPRMFRREPRIKRIVGALARCHGLAGMTMVSRGPRIRTIPWSHVAARASGVGFANDRAAVVVGQDDTYNGGDGNGREYAPARREDIPS